jgi:hypothetical protein
VNTPGLWPPDGSRAREGTEPWPADLYRQRYRAHLHQSSIRVAQSEQRETRNYSLYSNDSCDERIRIMVERTKEERKKNQVVSESIYCLGLGVDTNYLLHVLYYKSLKKES